MEDIVQATEDLIDAIIDLHPNIDVDNPKQLRLYLAIHECKGSINNHKLKKHNDKNQKNISQD